MTKIDLTPIETEASRLRAEVEGLREQLRQAQERIRALEYRDSARFARSGE
jgi:predicted ATP-grasp superfamily ATP-dependent carboligase